MHPLDAAVRTKAVKRIRGGSSRARDRQARRPRARCGLAALLAVGVLVAGAYAGEQSVDMDAAPASSWLRTDHYGVFRGEARVGWVRRTLERGTWDDVPSVAREIEMLVDIAGDGNRRRTLERSVFGLDGEQLLRSLVARTEEQGHVVERRVTRNASRFDIVTLRDGERTTGATQVVDVALADELGVERLIAASRARAGADGDGADGDGGAVGAEVVVRGLSMRTMSRTVRRLRVTSVEGLIGQDPSAMRFVVTLAEASSEGDITVDGDGVLVEGPLASGLRLVRMTESEARDESTLTSVEVTTRIRMTARLGDVHALRTLRVRFPATSSTETAPFAVTGRQGIEVDDDGMVLSVRVGEFAGVVTDGQRELALGPGEGIDPADQTLVAAATRVLRGTSRRAVQAARLAEFTSAHISEDAVLLDEPTAVEILRGRRGDCTEHTRLFVALARAAGIPARAVEGLIWLGDDQQSFGWHRWAEVELDGRWRPIDPTGGRLPAHAAHLRVRDGAREAGELDDLRLELESVER